MLLVYSLLFMLYCLKHCRYLKVDHMAKATHYNILPLYDFMNATKVFRFTDTWGYYINNSWNGMMGDIIHGEAELCGT